MENTIKKIYQYFTSVAVAILLIICYFQQKELARLRKEIGTNKVIKTEM
jgi:hypothetical protein